LSPARDPNAAASGAVGRKAEPDARVRSTCPYCGVGCGVEVGVKNGKIASIRGDADHPANFGKLCPKPAGLPEAIHSADRLTHPLRRTSGGDLARVSWDEALDELAQRLGEDRKDLGPNGVGMYISGQLMTEDYYAVNKLARGALGTNNLDSNSRLCMSSAVAGYAGAFGTDGPPASYADITYSECFLLVGTNTAECHPITFGRIKERKKAPEMSVIVADPRRTATAEIADLHLPIRPGTDIALLNAMLRTMISERLIDEEYIRRHTSHFEETAANVREWHPARAGKVCGVPPRDIVRAARMFGGAEAAMSLWSMGVNQSAVGTQKNRAIINLHLATGQIGKPGAGPFSLTGQPNAMGGRETGGLAHLLPGYRKIENEQHRREVEGYWGVEPGRIEAEPGLHALEMFESVRRGETRTLWVSATNPAVSMPDLTRTKKALGSAGFLVVQDAYPTETTAYADLVLPAAQWGEKEGTMTNSERRVSRLAKVVDPPGEARADWEIYAAVGRRLYGGGLFDWENSSRVFDEYRGLTRDTPVDITGLSHERLSHGPVQWPVPERLGRERRGTARSRSVPETELEHPGTPRLYTDARFNTPDRRARFAVTAHESLREPASDDYPLTLSTGRIKNQWHTMSRTGRSAKLVKGLNGPFVEIHPEAAEAAGIESEDSVRIVSARGSFEARAVVSESIRPGAVFVPFHWGALWTSGGSVNEATHGAICPTSKQPELNGAAVRLQPVATGQPGNGEQRKDLGSASKTRGMA
jgi:ferredoxin-nitrate reductase